MGFRVQLIAVKGKYPDIIQREFGVLSTRKYEEEPESPVVGTELVTNAYLLYINDPNQIEPDSSVYEILSKDASLIACYANETLMNSYTCAWVDGVQEWSVYHDAQKGETHLETHGTLPPELLAIKDRMFAEQKENDGVDFVFDIPVELFVAVGGVRYDRDIPGPDRTPWETLVSRD